MLHPCPPAIAQKTRFLWSGGNRTTEPGRSPPEQSALQIGHSCVSIPHLSRQGKKAPPLHGDAPSPNPSGRIRLIESHLRPVTCLASKGTIKPSLHRYCACVRSFCLYHRAEPDQLVPGVLSPGRPSPHHRIAGQFHQNRSCEFGRLPKQVRRQACSSSTSGAGQVHRGATETPMRCGGSAACVRE